MSEPILTPADLLRMPDGERHLELIGNRVRLREKGARASYVGGQVQFALHNHARPRGHWVFGWSMGYNCFPYDPNEVRHASVTIVTAGRMPPEMADEDPAFLTIAPDLVADSVPPTYPRADEIADADAWLAAGAGCSGRSMRPTGASGCTTRVGRWSCSTKPTPLPRTCCPGSPARSRTSSKSRPARKQVRPNRSAVH